MKNQCFPTMNRSGTRGAWHRTKPRMGLGWHVALLSAIAIGVPPGSVVAQTDWEVMTSGTTHMLRDVWGSGGNDLFAVGDDGTILHYDGSSWATMYSGLEGSLRNLHGVWGSGSKDVYAVGDWGTIWHYDGTSWDPWTVYYPSNDLTGVWGTGSNNVYFVDEGSTVFHYDGSSCQEVYPLNKPFAPGVAHSLRGIGGSGPGDIFAVGELGTGPAWMHYTGTTWPGATLSGLGRLHGVWCGGPGDAYLVGLHGMILHEDGVHWPVMTSGTTQHLYGVWGSTSSDIFAVGENGTILHYDGSNWSAMKSGTTERLLGVWGSGSNNVFAVGTNGTILRYRGPVVRILLPELLPYPPLVNRVVPRGGLLVEYLDRTDVRVSAIPDKGHLFSHWEGDVPDGHETDNPLRVALTRDIALTPVFTETALNPDQRLDQMCGGGALGMGVVTLLPLMFMGLWRSKPSVSTKSAS